MRYNFAAVSWSERAQLAAARGADLVILQRKLLSVVQIGILRSAARRIVFDLDDALFHRDRDQEGHFVQLETGGEILGHNGAADLVIVGNDYLGRQAEAHIDPARIRVVPTCVDAGRYPLAEHDAVGPAVRLAWIGQACTLQGMSGAEACLTRRGE